MALIIRHPVVAVLAATALLLCGCSAADSSAGQPLASANVQKGEKGCEEAPNTAPSAGIPAWNSQTGWAINWFYNTSASPVKLESVSLIDSHGLILHKNVFVYEMRHSENPLILADGWGKMSLGANPAMWARRQSVFGAVIAPQVSTVGTPGPNARDTYEVVLDISAKTPAGGYAIGLQVTYREGNAQYTIRTYQGIAIGPPGPDGPKCQAQENAIDAAWSHV